MIKQLMMLCVAAFVAMGAMGAWANIRFGDTYYWFTDSNYDFELVDSELQKSFGVYVYTGYKKNQDQEYCDDMMVVEVIGAASKEEIVPIIENDGFNGKFEVSVLSDEEFRVKVMPPMSTSSKWEEDYNWTDGREPGDISGVPADCSAIGYLGWNPYSYNYESENDWDYEWPIDLWPNGETKSDRYWIVVSVKPAANMRWYGMDSFRIRLKNQNLITDNLYIVYSPDEAWPYWGNGMYKSFRRGFEIANTKMVMSPYLWELWSVSYNAPLHAYWIDCEDEGKLNLKLPEAGTLYVSSTSIDNLENQIGRVVGVDSIKLTCIRENWSMYERLDWSDADRREYFFENCMSFDYPQVGLLEIKVNSARTISFETDYIEFNRLQFYPANKKSVAIEASYVSIANENKYPLRNGEMGLGFYLQGYVEGMGVYKVGETVSLKAISGTGEEFSHWELMYGNFPEGIDTSKTTLNFKVTDACAGTADERKQMVVKAVWKERMWGGASDESSLLIPDAASVYDGYLMNGDVVVGTMQAKVAKPKKGEAKVTVTVQIAGEKKLSIKGQMNAAAGAFIGETKDGRVLSLTFNMDEIKGAFGNYEISGVRNLFSSKDKSEKATADELLAPWLGAMNMITGGGTLSVTIAKKGKVTVKGTIGGEKFSAKTQALIGEDMICIPVIYSKKTVKLAFTIWLPLDGGEAEVVGLDGAIIGKAGTLKSGAKFYIDDAILSDIEGIVTYNGKPALPDGESVSQSKTKWVVANGVKAAKVAYKKGVLSITEGKKGAGIANISGLKLTYKSKDGSFKGSFTVYAIENGKLKKHKATVEGILIGDVGYGTITIKKVGTWAVTIE